MERKYIVYKITNNLNGMVYIGCTKNTLECRFNQHSCSNSYIGKSIRKNGIDNFTKEILYCFDNQEDMYDKEAEIVTSEFVTDVMTYNLKIGGFGGFDHINNALLIVDGKYITPTTGKTTVKDKDGNTFMVEVTDPRIKSGELVGVVSRTVTVKDKNGNKFRVPCDDPRIKSGELVGTTRGNIVINNGTINKNIQPTESDTYLKDGWKKGRFKTNKFFVSNDLLKKTKKVTRDEFNIMSSEWYIGRKSYKEKK